MAIVSIAFTGVMLGACDWVDSTGNQTIAPAPTAADIFLDDTPSGSAISINEMTNARIVATRQSTSGLNQTFSWSEEPLDQGNLSICDGEEGFNLELAAGSLLEACKSPAECELGFDAIDSNSSSQLAQFAFDVPVLDASIGLRYALSIEDSEGNISDEEYTFCLIAMNEAPIANDDTFVIPEGSVLNVTAITPNLLTNDVDDTDVSNTEFAIVPEALVGPRFAAFFELGNDGSFTYQSNVSSSRENRLDTFTYQLSDGVFLSTGTVNIRIVASNQEPLQLSAIPVLEATEGELFSEDLSTRFNDPEGGELAFSLSPRTPFVRGSGLDLSAAGVLSGTPSEADVGSYALELVVSDGGLEVVADVVLEVAAAPVEVSNRDPVFVARSVFSQTINVRSPMRPVTARFTDADGDVLTFSMAGSRTLPFGVTLNASTGVLSGTPLITGSFTALRVRASDPSGGTNVSSAFSLNVLRVR